MIKVPKSSLLGVILDHWGPYWGLIHAPSIKHPHCMVPNISKPPIKLWLLGGEYWGWMVYHAQNPVSICGMTQDDSGWLRMTQDDSGWRPMTCFYMLNPGMRGHLLRQELATPWNAEAAWKACQVRLSCEFNKTGAAWFICKNDFSWFLSIYIYI